MSPLCVSSSFPSCGTMLEELNEACHAISRTKDILVPVIGKKSKLYDGLLSLRARSYLSREVNLRAAGGIKLTNMEVMFEVGKHHTELSE